MIKKTLSMEERVAERMALTGITKVAYLALSELVSQGRADFLFLREECVSEWWDKMKKKEKREYGILLEEDKKEELKKAALAKLTAEERKLLGV